MCVCVCGVLIHRKKIERGALYMRAAVCHLERGAPKARQLLDAAPPSPVERTVVEDEMGTEKSGQVLMPKLGY